MSLNFIMALPIAMIVHCFELEYSYNNRNIDIFDTNEFFFKNVFICKFAFKVLIRNLLILIAYKITKIKLFKCFFYYQSN